MLECPTCKQKQCFQHCNHCGIDIKWLNHLGDPYHYVHPSGKRLRLPYEIDESVHRCMVKGTNDGKYYNSNEINEYVLDEYRTIRRYGGPVFRCDFCGVKGDLPVMKTHHTNEKQFDCNDKLMKKFFAEKPKTYIDHNNYRIDEY